MPGTLSGWETLILMAPFGALLALAVFGLDGQVARRRRPTRRPRAFCEMQPGGEGLLRDPDGRIWNMGMPYSRRTRM